MSEEQPVARHGNSRNAAFWTPLFLAWRSEPRGKTFNWWLDALRKPEMKASWTQLAL